MSQNRELIKSLYEAFARGDAATLLGALAPDVQWYEAEGTSWADGNPYDSPQRVGEEVIGRILAEYDGYTVDPHQFLAEEDMVVALGHYTGTHRASSQLFHAPFAHVWTLRDGRITKFYQYTDTAQIQRQQASASAGM
jgi:uncharacterized protein